MFNVLHASKTLHFRMMGADHWHRLSLIFFYLPWSSQLLHLVWGLLCNGILLFFVFIIASGSTEAHVENHLNVTSL